MWSAEANPWTRVILKCGGEHSIGGVVSGLSTGEHLLLVNHGQDYLTVSTNGKYRFDAEVRPGDEHAVGVAKSPPAKQCTISGKYRRHRRHCRHHRPCITWMALPPPNGIVIGVEDVDLASVPKAVADAAGGQTDECTVAGKYLRTQLGEKLCFVANSCGNKGLRRTRPTIDNVSVLSRTGPTDPNLRLRMKRLRPPPIRCADDGLDG